MTDLHLIFTTAGGLYLIMIGVIVSTPNIFSAVVFKAMPVILGLAVLIQPLKQLGIF